MENYITSENILLIGSVLLGAGVLIGKWSYRLGLPILLVFLVVGMLFGTDGLGIEFGDMHAAQFIGMIALCIILFSGGMDTRISAIKPVMAPGLLLATLGVVLTAALTGLFVWWLSGMKWTNIHFALLPSLLLAATMSSTDSASVFGILGTQKVHLRQNLRPLLELESGSNDPMAYMLTTILIETIAMGADLSVSRLLRDVAVQFAIGAAGGYVMGKATVWLIGAYRRITGSEDSDQASNMISILVLASVFFTFAATTQLKGNGYLAVYVAGIIVGNAKIQGRRGVSRFLSGMTWLAQITVFLMLGLLVNPHQLLSVAPVALLIGAFMIVLGRPLSVFASLLPVRGLTFRARCMVSWVGLRGAVPIIFATYPVISNIPGADHMFNIVFFVTLLSLLLQGTTIVRSARLLKLTAPEPPSDDFDVEIGETLPTALETLTLTPAHLAAGNTLRTLGLPTGNLVMMVRRDGEYIVPNGNLELRSGDVLLIIKQIAQSPAPPANA